MSVTWATAGTGKRSSAGQQSFWQQPAIPYLLKRTDRLAASMQQEQEGAAAAGQQQRMQWCLVMLPPSAGFAPGRQQQVGFGPVAIILTY
jgi:hypothetical protein